MNVIAVIGRELRAESRRPVNSWLRGLSAGALCLIAANFVLSSQVALSQLGPALFNLLHQTLFYGFWVVAPLMTADCISRERREGTLPLLFLTPLSVADVIAGKSAVHILRALTLFLAAVPILVMPLFLGGVGWLTVIVSVHRELCVVLLGIAAGLFASVAGGTTIQVMVRAELCALAVVCVWLLAAALSGSHYGSPGQLAFIMGKNLLLCATLFVLVLQLSADRLRQTWHETPAAPERPAWVDLFSTSTFWQTAFYWNRGSTLDHNPVAWLQEYSWTARLTKWGWCVVLLLGELIVLVGQPYRHANWQLGLAAVLGMGVAFSAAGSFRRERETGLLEVLLVTPLSVRQLVGGRMWGITCHYLPALAVLAVCFFGDRVLNPRGYHGELWALLYPNPASFIAMMLVGLYLSLGRLNFLLAWAASWVLAFVLPASIAVSLGMLAQFETLQVVFLCSSLQLVLGGLCGLLLSRALSIRAFLRPVNA